MIEETSGLPGVRSVAAAFTLPFHGIGASSGGLPIDGVEPGQPQRTGIVTRSIVTPGYFQTMGIPLLRGRVFSASDRREEWEGEWWNDGLKVVIINETLASRDFPGDDPIGKRIAGTSIVGIVGDVSGQAGAWRYTAFFLQPQRSMTLTVRTATDPESLIAAVRAQVWAIDPDQPVTLFSTMAEELADSFASERFATLLMSVFGVLALILVTGGIYGVSSYAVARRTQEFGIRRALGAEALTVFHVVLRESLWLSLTGLAIGLVAALWLTRLIVSQLFGATATDPLTFTAVCVGLIAVALAASYLPARRATRADPVDALRYE